MEKDNLIINSISPVDGRYSSKTSVLSDYFSEKALIKYRVYTEVKYLMMLLKEKNLNLRKLTDTEDKKLNRLHEITDDEANMVKCIETKGYGDIPATNHDVKAVEYFIKLKFRDSSLKDVIEMVHFALTSEDINNISYSLMIREGFNKVIFPAIIEIYSSLYDLAVRNKNSQMLARTHGQPASPTTFGKEILVFVSRIREEILLLKEISLLVKLSGATGNYNAHDVVYGNIDWQKFSENLVDELKKDSEESHYEYCSWTPLKLRYNRVTTQIEPHDSYARLFDSIRRINVILLDFCQDTWRYISDGWIKQKPVKGEIGSSAMPHKVNPIDFENAEGNLGIANALFSFFSSKLSVSRLQRDLSDSTVLRNIGVAFAHSLISYQSILKGLSKIEVDRERMLSTLDDTPEVIAEAYQNILRTTGFDRPYEALKEISRGKKIRLEDFYAFAENLDINAEIRDKLLRIKPENYTGLAEKIVEEFDPDIY